MQITKNAIALFAYTLKDDDGDLLDSTEESDPLAYIHGVGQLIPGLEQELEGKGKGDSFEIRIPPEKAYGPKNQELIQPVPRDQLPDDVEIEVGMQFQAQSEDGSQVVTVVEIDGDQISLDANHPLAGVALNFAVTVVEVREATPDELEHGHAHGPGGEDH